MRKLEGVHPDLVKVVIRALELSEVDFGVLEGLRTLKRQRQLLEAGASSTMNSRHLTGHAVDLGAYVGSNLRWDWPLYYKIYAAMKKAACELGVSIFWGGHWRDPKDGPHFQLTWKRYPK